MVVFFLFRQDLMKVVTNTALSSDGMDEDINFSVLFYEWAYVFPTCSKNSWFKT